MGGAKQKIVLPLLGAGILAENPNCAGSMNEPAGCGWNIVQCWTGYDGWQSPSGSVLDGAAGATESESHRLNRNRQDRGHDPYCLPGPKCWLADQQ